LFALDIFYSPKKMGADLKLRCFVFAGVQATDNPGQPHVRMAFWQSTQARQTPRRNARAGELAKVNITSSVMV